MYKCTINTHNYYTCTCVQIRVVHRYTYTCTCTCTCICTPGIYNSVFEITNYCSNVCVSHSYSV